MAAGRAEEHGLVKKLATGGSLVAAPTKKGLRKLEQAAIAHKAAIRVMFEERYTQSMLAERPRRGAEPRFSCARKLCYSCVVNYSTTCALN